MYQFTVSQSERCYEVLHRPTRRLSPLRRRAGGAIHHAPSPGRPGEDHRLFARWALQGRRRHRRYHWLFQCSTLQAALLAIPAARIIARAPQVRQFQCASSRVLHLDIIPQSYQPTPARRGIALVRHRSSMRQRPSSEQGPQDPPRLQRDRRDLLLAAGEALRRSPLNDSDRFISDQCRALRFLEGSDSRCRSAPCVHQEARRARPAPRAAPEAAGGGRSHLRGRAGRAGRRERFLRRSRCGLRGSGPGARESAGKFATLGITKQVRAAALVLVEASWRRSAARNTGRSMNVETKRGGRRAIVAIARRLLE